MRATAYRQQRREGMCNQFEEIIEMTDIETQSSKLDVLFVKLLELSNMVFYVASLGSRDLASV